ncbi:zinc ribbon domain-containing protein [Brotaphodocola sp.]|uniref:zinc ribbon domain-containing protein n=1 Tax=Brotaphodocola sp. TaxID=3073577 RepID=UPI003D7C44FF
MGFFDSLKDSLQEKTEKEATSNNNFDLEISATEEKIVELLTKIGRVYMEKHALDNNPEYVEYVKQIQILEEEKQILERNKLATQGLRVCEHCHQIITLDSAFCNKCGSKLNPIVVSSIDGKFCPSCGASLSEGDAFCTACGAKVN